MKLSSQGFIMPKQSNSSQLPIDVASENQSTIENIKLRQENEKLKNTLNQLIKSANQNEKTQLKFSQLELYFLQASNYQVLMNRILNDLKNLFRLSQVELTLFDNDKNIQNLIQEIYGSLTWTNLRYTTNIDDLKKLYSGNSTVQLFQDSNMIKSLFIKQPIISQSVAILPLTRANQLIGSLHLGSNEFSRFEPSLATHFLQHLASIIGVCIENSINQERYIHLSLVDILTKTKNRRYFFQASAKEIARSSRSTLPLSCLFIDIDHFKQINDKRGHLIGDKALQKVAQQIQPMLRQSDILSRFGGEEFTVLLPECDQAQALEIAERIRHRISQVQIKDDELGNFNLTISVGISCWNPVTNTSIDPNEIQDFLIKSADDAVYQAKLDGRNRVKLSHQTLQPNLSIQKNI